MNFTASEKINPYNGKKLFGPGIRNLYGRICYVVFTIPIYIVF
jgi:hypothetical protein